MNSFKRATIGLAAILLFGGLAAQDVTPGVHVANPPNLR